ncbi:MAG: PEP-CTERM sorting domain-containing protein [Planctomycetota bacterium]
MTTPTRPFATAALAAASLTLTAATTTHAQQGPAELWSVGGANNGAPVSEFDETTQSFGPTLFEVAPVGPANAAEIEYTGSTFVVSNVRAGEITVWDATSYALIATVPYNLTASTAGIDAITALEYVDGVMYAASAERGGSISEFGTLDLTTGVFTPIAVTGYAGPLSGLAFDGTTMYASTGGGDNGLYAIDLATGITSLTGEASTVEAYYDLEFGADGVLYAMGDNALPGGSSDELFTVDPLTGLATPQGALNAPPSSTGITSTFIIPEPTSLALLALGGLLVARRRRRSA